MLIKGQMGLKFVLESASPKFASKPSQVKIDMIIRRMFEFEASLG